MFFSLIVPAKNEKDRIERCINSLLNIDYLNKNYEVIIVNDNSTDNTLKILNNLNLPKNYKIIDRKRKNGFVAGVLNDGLRYISDKSEAIGIIDSDCLVSKNILNCLSNNFDKFYGGIQPLEWHYNNDESIIAKLLHLLCIYENYNLSNQFKIGHFYHRKTLNIFKKYNENSILEDKELSDKFKETNIPIKTLSETLIYRTFPNDIKSTYSQQYRYALGDFVINYNKSIIQNDILIPQILLNELFISYYLGDLFLFKLFFVITFIILLLLNISWFNFEKLYYISALNNSPECLKQRILKQKNNTIFIYISSVFMAYFIYFIKLLPFYKLPYSLEEIKWNRFK